MVNGKMWNQIEALRGWLDSDAEKASPADVRLLRILKIGEEYGEAAEAVHGALGANPRKGRSHTWDDVETELCDVIVTAAVALDTISGNARQALAERLEELVNRAGVRPSGSHLSEA